MRYNVGWNPTEPGQHSGDSPMKLRHEILLPASPDQVADILGSADDAPKWQDGLERMETVRGAHNEVGALARLHYVEQGRSYVMQDELLECEPDRRWKSRVSGNGMTIIVDTVLEDVGEGTQLRMVWDGRPDAVWARLVFPLARPTISSHMEADLESLRQLVVSRCREGAGST
jgi:hypothetical protein